MVQPVFAADPAVEEAVKEEVGGSLREQAKGSMPITSDLLEQAIATEGAAGADLIEITAKVVATNDFARMAKLKGPSGESKWYTVPAKVWRNADIKPNDMVNVKYYEAVATELVPGTGGTLGHVQEKPVDEVQLAPGEKPAAEFQRGITLFGNISAMDKATGKVTVRTREGEEKTIRVQDRSVLEGVKVGDNVRATYVEALAVSVESAN
jgi:Cu/Ag efflux protein CusF